MKAFSKYIFLLVVFYITQPALAFAQQDTIRRQTRNVIVGNIENKIIIDTTSYQHVILDTTISKDALRNVIISNLFKQDTKKEELHRVVKYDEFKGKIIDSIIIIREKPFDPSNAKKKIIRSTYKAGNAIHRITNVAVIKKNLLFKSGSWVNPQNINNSVALLRGLGIFANVSIAIIQSKAYKDMVNVYIVTQDNLPISAGVMLRRRADAEVFLRDRNFMGTGNSLTFRYYVNLYESNYTKGAEVSYDIDNIKGTYIDAHSAVALRSDAYKLRLKLDKDFNVDGDYAFGVEYLNKEEHRTYYTISDWLRVQSQYAELWGGQSFTIGDFNNNFYFSAGTDMIKYAKRPDVTANFNPFFHNALNFTAAIGFFREKHYSGNMIYGYGNTESIPYGYKLEMLGGYRIGEFEKLPYVGLNFDMGNMVSIGYLRGSINVGTFIESSERKTQKTTFNVSSNYFSNLIPLHPEYYLRQFVTFRYTTGYNLLQGEGNVIEFGKYYGLHSVSGGEEGYTRLELISESVLFNPMQFYGFRFAFFTFFNIGTIGDELNSFKNEFFGIAGLGVRVRNDKLVFNTLQLRLGVALRSHSEWRNALYNVTSEQQYRANGFLPSKPSYVPFD